MPLTERVRIVKSKKGSAVVELVRKQECNNCKVCAFNKRSSIKIPVKCDIDCKSGDWVIIEMPEKTIKWTSVILFLCPLLLMLTAVCITAKYVWYVQIIAIACALLIGLAVSILCDYFVRRNSKYIPTVKEIINEKNDIGENQ